LKLRLIYFNVPFWRAEVSRLALHIGGIPFDDVRPNREEFLAMKQGGELPYGQLPVLDIDGVRIAQSLTIARLCGQISGLYPKADVVAAARVDEILDTASQITEAISPTMREPDPQRKTALRATLGSETLPHWFSLLEKRLSKNANAPFFVGTTLTVADLAIWRLADWLTSGVLDGIPSTLLDPFPRLTALYNAVDERADVRTWMDARYQR
jgi:glutathione S-transferase